MTSEFPLKQIVEGALLASESPLSLDNLMSLFEFDPPTRQDVKQVLEEIEADGIDRGFELKKLASGYRFQVKQDYADWVGRLWEERPQRYTRALLETLALIAYRQPITRGDIEEVRGVAVSTNIIRSLLEREWIRIVGHRDVPGRPAMYATTKSFLDYFNLTSLDELPTLSEIRDLDDLESRLTLDEPLIEVKTLTLDETEDSFDDLEDADLDAVAQTVDTIRDNIRRVMAPEDNGADDLDEAIGDEDQSIGGVLSDHQSSEADQSPLVDQDVPRASVERSPPPGELVGDTNLDIIRAAFADEDEDPSMARRSDLDTNPQEAEQSLMTEAEPNSGQATLSSSADEADQSS